MPWFYVDDGFSDSKPVLNMPDRHRLAACGLWVLAGSWSAKEELDGFVPTSKLRQLGARPTIIAALTDPGPMFAPLCTETSAGIQFNSWEKWQKTREELAEKRREDAERQRAWRAAHPDVKPVAKKHGRNAPTSDDKDSSRCDTPVTDGVTNGVTDTILDDVSQCDLARAGARPDPTRPDPIERSNGYVERAGYVSDASARDETAFDETFEAATKDRNDDLSPPVSIGATRLVATVIGAGKVSDADRTILRINASEAMHSGRSEDDVAECLRIWLTKPHLGPHALLCCLTEVDKRKLNGAGGPKIATSDRRFLEVQAMKNQAAGPISELLLNHPQKELPDGS